MQNEEEEVQTGKGIKGFQKGHKGFKPKGVTHAMTIEARELFIMTLEAQVPNVHQAFADVLEKDPAKYLDLFAKYAQYFIPKKVESEVNFNIEKPIFKQLELDVISNDDGTI
ncbi:hypothetical protein [Flavobacterium sp.]|uniref:hypothetical protein n=1 Tax=Flavobacterium sp. TaxID=239 RepID=UPI00333E6B33